MPDSNGVEWVLFGAESKRLYAGNGDGSIHIWIPAPLEGRNDHQVLVGHEKKVSAMVQPIDGRFVITGSYDGTARVWPMGPRELVRLACYTAGRSPTQAEWQAWLPGQEYKPICG
jgi:WD40 repeat protein